MFSFNEYNNVEIAINKLLKKLYINIDPLIINTDLEKHPDYPSLLAICDVLTNLNIENQAYRIRFDELTSIQCPFIAYTNVNNGDFVVVDQIREKSVIVSGEKWNKRKLSTKQFKEIFKDVVLVARGPKNVSVNSTLKNILTTIKTPAAAICTLVSFLLALGFHTSYFATLNWQILFFTIFKSAGLFTSVLLLMQSVDSNNSLIQKLCKTGAKTDCNTILSSKAAKVFEGLSWSEVGFFYFGGTWLALLFGDDSALVWRVLILLNFLSLPYTFYSIYYQVKIAKQWCLLCCTIQAVLWLEFLALIPYVLRNPLSFSDISFVGGDSIRTLSSLFICLVIPVILWFFLKPILMKLQELQPLKKQLRLFKYNTELFKTMLTEQPRHTIPDEDWCIILGNEKANNIITMVTNPYCQPCAKTHSLLNKLLNERTDIQARIVFAVSNEDDDNKTQVSRHLIALDDLKDKDLIKDALHNWYGQEQKNYETWAKAYPVELKNNEYHKIERQNEWTKNAGINATPAIMFNEYRLPDLYQLSDLKYMFA